jgi:hypothetical protein
MGHNLVMKVQVKLSNVMLGNNYGEDNSNLEFTI